MEKLHLVHIYLECGLVFLIFIQERLKNFKKLTKKVGKNSMHGFTRCARTQARGLAQTI